ncbi:MAG: hypothetical protein LBB58_05285, partial [Cellulomonadaceae bacterium]|nr:hypothetical protein [Cellulomonadaceae bacterium]
MSVLSGCVSAANVTSPVEWTEPGWFAQVRMEQENYNVSFQNCLQELGVSSKIIPGPFAPTVGSVVDGIPRSPERERVEHEAVDHCFDALPRPEYWSLPLDQVAYQRMLDSRYCIIDQGFEIPEPPSLERWLDIGGQWSAHGFVLHDVSFDEFLEL